MYLSIDIKSYSIVHFLMFKKSLSLFLILFLISCGGGGGDSGGGDGEGGGTGPSNDPPVAQFTGAPLSGNAPLSVTFISSSTFTSTNRWDFNNDGNFDETGTQVTYTYNNPGTFSVKLESTGPGGTDTLTRENYITVNSTPPSISFSGNPTSGTKDLRVQFFNNSQNYSSLVWNFGDGNSSSEENPYHIYTSTGSYDVSLTATGDGGTETGVETGYITVSDIQTPAFIIDEKYINASSGSSITVDWNILGASAVAAAQATISWDNTKLSLSNVDSGEFFEGNTSPLFVYEESNNGTNSTLSIYTSSLSSDKPSANGDGTLANLTFIVNANSGEIATIDFGSNSDEQTLDVDGNNIALSQTVNGYIIVE